MTPARMVASQAVIRRAASMKSKASSGTEERNTVTHRLATGLSTCWNISYSRVRDLASISDLDSSACYASSALHATNSSPQPAVSQSRPTGKDNRLIQHALPCLAEPGTLGTSLAL